MDLTRLGLIVILIGFTVAFIGILIPIYLVALGNVEAGVGAGVCIVLLFIPICFGYGEHALPLMILALGLALAILIVGLIVFRAIKRSTVDLGYRKNFV